MTTILTQMGRTLHEEHQRTLAMLNDLEVKMFGPDKDVPFDPSDAADRKRLDAVLQVVDQDVGRHFAFEEDVLFPILDEVGAVDMTQMLTDEHNAIRPLADRLGTIARDALSRGFDASTWDEFLELARELVEREMFHIQKEEMGLVHGLSHVLDPETDRDLSMKYAEFQA